MRLLFVCVGNTCRSQMAEALARDRGHFAQSAGTHPGTRIAPNAVVVLNELGINTEGHTPKSVAESNVLRYPFQQTGDWKTQLVSR
jgi:arsenate reductase